MKTVLLSIAVFALAASAYAQDSQSLGEVARQNQEQKKAKRTITNDDVASGSMPAAEPAPAAVASANGTDASADPKPDQTQTADETSTDQPKPDRSNVVGDVPGYTPEPKDRIETLKKHASQWEAIIADFEKKIAAETNLQKRDSLETMLEHARQNQAKDAAEQSALEKSEAEKANAQGGEQPGQEPSQPQ